MVGTEHNYGAGYLTRERWFSYATQVSLIADLKPKRVAEIGVGPGVVGPMIESSYPGCHYVSVDIEHQLAPHLCASVTALPFADGTMDAIFCCQVLEHLPFELFTPALKELSRSTSRRVVISLPDVSPFFFLRFRGSRRYLPGLWKGFSLPHPFPQSHDFFTHGQHHWEIGKKGFPVDRIVDQIRKTGLHLKDSFRMVDRPYWHFFILDKQL